MDFPLENVLEALHATNDPKQQQDAVEYLYKWGESPGCLHQICEILRTNDDNKFVLGQILPRAKICVVQNWLKYTDEDRTFFRETFSIKFDNYQGEQYILDFLVAIIAEMALKDWPHEWPQCMDYYIQRCADSIEHCIKSFNVIAKILESINDSDNLTTMRRNELNQLAMNHHERFFEILDGSLANYDPNQMRGPVLVLLSSLSLSAPIERIFGIFSLHTFFTNLIVDPQLCQIAIKTLTNILLVRNDADQIFTDHYQEIIVYFMRFFCEFTEEELEELFKEDLQELREVEIAHLELTDEIFEFILRYLEHYTRMLEDACVYEDSIRQPNFSIVHLIYSGLLRTELPYNCVTPYWDLWRDILMRLIKAHRSKNIFDSLTPVAAVFDDELIDQMVESFFEALETAISGGQIKNTSAQAAWVAICSLRSEEVFEFISHQSQISSKMCYALGVLNTVINASQEQQLLEETLPALIEFNQSSQSAEFSCSLLYYLSHSTRSLANLEILMQTFVHLLASNFASEDENLAKSTAAAFMYSASRSPHVYWKINDADGSPLFRIVLNEVNTCAGLAEENALRIFCGIARIAKSIQNEEIRNEIYDMLFNAAITQIQTSDQDSIARGLKLIAQLAEMDLPGVKAKLKDIFVPLLGLVERARDMHETYFFMQSTATIIMIFKQFDLTDAGEAMNMLMEILLNSASMPESALYACNDIRRQFDPVERYADEVREAYVKPFLDHWGIEKVTPVLQFFRFWNIKDVEIENVIDLAASCIIDARATIGKEACKLLRRVFAICSTENAKLVMARREQIIRALFTAISDTYHLQVFDSLAKTILAFYKIALLVHYNMREFDNEVAAVLQENVQFADVRNEVSPKLRQVIGNVEEFKGVLRELLVTIKSANMSDKKLFKREFKLDSIRSQIESLADTEEKSAIKAEELELLPMLAKLSITKNYHE